VTSIVISGGRRSAFFQVRPEDNGKDKLDHIELILPQTSVTFPLKPCSSSDLYKSRDQVKLPSPEKLALFRMLVGGAKSGNVPVREALSEV
jgi:hypothetical protein